MATRVLEVKRRDGKLVLVLERRQTDVRQLFASTNVADDVTAWLKDGLLDRTEVGRPLRRTLPTDAEFFHRLADHLKKRGFVAEERDQAERMVARDLEPVANPFAPFRMHLTRPTAFRPKSIAPTPPVADAPVPATFLRAASC